MPKNIKWILGILIALSLVVIANAAQLNQYYMPVVYVKHPTPTKTPKPTATPVPGQCLSGKTTGLCITKIDYHPISGGSLNEFISIKNLGSSSVDMENWRVVNDKSEKYDFPKYSLNANTTVKLWTKTGTNDITNLYMNRAIQFWSDTKDCAYLRDDSHPRKTIDAICYGFNGLFYTPILDQIP